MAIVSQSEFRANMAKLLDKVEEDQKELIITRQGKSPLAVIPLEELESWHETLYLKSNPANAERLDAAINRLRDGKSVSKSAEELGLLDE